MIMGMGLSLYEGDIEVGQEYKVGTITISGTTYDRYMKIVNLGAMPSGNPATKSVAHGITGVAGWLDVRGIAYTSASGSVLPLPYPQTNANYSLRIFINGANIVLAENDNYSSYANGFAILEYFK